MLPFFSRFFNKTMKKQPIRLTPAQAKQKMESEPVTILDVRQPQEFAQGIFPER